MYALGNRLRHFGTHFLHATTSRRSSRCKCVLRLPAWHRTPAELSWRATDHLEYIGGGSWPLQGFSRSSLRPRVFDGDEQACAANVLRSSRCFSESGPGRTRTTLIADCGLTANHRHDGDCPIPAGEKVPGPRRHRARHMRFHVGKIDHLAIEDRVLCIGSGRAHWESGGPLVFHVLNSASAIAAPHDRRQAAQLSSPRREIASVRFARWHRQHRLRVSRRATQLHRGFRRSPFAAPAPPLPH